MNETVLRVLRGLPSDVELAAVVAVLAAAVPHSAGGLSGIDAAAPDRAATWGDPVVALRLPPRPGRGAWRHAA